MSVYYTLCFLAAMAIFIAFANQYVIKIQTTIAITAGSMLISALIVLFGKLGWFNLEPLAISTMQSIDFQNFLLKGILGFLLFAGGIGITPILCMAERLAEAGAAFELHYCARSVQHAAFVERIRDSAFAARVHFHFDDAPLDHLIGL